MTTITAIGEYVCIKKDADDERTTASGIIYGLKYNKDHFITGEVVAVGPSVKEDIQLGDKVFAQRIDSIPIKFDNETQGDYQFVNSKFVYGKIV